MNIKPSVFESFVSRDRILNNFDLRPSNGTYILAFCTVFGLGFDFFLRIGLIIFFLSQGYTCPNVLHGFDSFSLANLWTIDCVHLVFVA